MRQLIATFHVSTPLFVGNAAQEPELLAAPFKRALRFWWRALNYHLVEPEAEAPYAKLLAREAELFGSAADEGDKKAGRCPFNLRVCFEHPGPQTIPRADILGKVLRGPGARYLGYGLAPAGAHVGRACYWSPGGFSIRAEFALSKNLGDVDELTDSLKILGLLGGIGGRNRRGFGSMSVTGLCGDAVPWQPPATDDQYAAMLHELLAKYKCATAPSLPEYTAFGPVSRIEIVEPENASQGDTPLTLLEWLGRLMQQYRSWGKNGYIGDRPMEGPLRFRRDHDWYLKWRSVDPDHPPIRTPLPERLVFGLPQPYTQTLRVIDSREKQDDDFLDRRASPFFVHVHRLGARRHVLMLALIPARFLPNAEVTIAPGEARYHEPYEPHFEVISKLFDACHRVGDLKGTPYFPNYIPVWP